MNEIAEIKKQKTETVFEPVLSILVNDDGQLQVNAPDDMAIETAIALLAQAQLIVLDAFSGDNMV